MFGDSRFKTDMKPQRPTTPKGTAARLVEASAEDCDVSVAQTGCSWQWSNEPLPFRPTEERRRAVQLPCIQWGDRT